MRGFVFDPTPWRWEHRTTDETVRIPIAPFLWIHCQSLDGAKSQLHGLSTIPLDGCVVNWLFRKSNAQKNIAYEVFSIRVPQWAWRSSIVCLNAACDQYSFTNPVWLEISYCNSYYFPKKTITFSLEYKLYKRIKIQHLEVF